MYEFQKLYQALSRKFSRALIKWAARNFLMHVKFYGKGDFDKHVHIAEIFHRENLRSFFPRYCKSWSLNKKNYSRDGKIEQQNQSTF